MGNPYRTLRIENRRYGPLWWGDAILGTYFIPLEIQCRYHTPLGNLVSGLFIGKKKHVKITWSETIRVYSKFENSKFSTFFFLFYAI